MTFTATRVMRRFGAVVVLVATLCVGPSARSQVGTAAQDSLAPPGAKPRWLPCEDWVMFHWLPYDEEQLLGLLGTDREGVERWLSNDRAHTLEQLVRRRGLTVQAAAGRLVGSWRGVVSVRRYRELRERARRTLTQGHLAQHLFSHFAHYPAVAMAARRVFGLSPLRYNRLRVAGHTPAEIGRRTGRGRRTVAAAALRVLERGARQGIARRETSAAQALRFLALQSQGLDGWLDQRIAPRRSLADGPYPRLRSRDELRCWLFAGQAGVRHLHERTAGRTRTLPAQGRT